MRLGVLPTLLATSCLKYQPVQNPYQDHGVPEGTQAVVNALATQPSVRLDNDGKPCPQSVNPIDLNMGVIGMQIDNISPSVQRKPVPGADGCYEVGKWQLTVPDKQVQAVLNIIDTGKEHFTCTSSEPTSANGVTSFVVACTLK